MRATKKEKILMLLTAAILLTIGIFAACNWSDFVHLFKEMVTGVEIVRENILDLGIAGILIISLIIVICFFFPVISSSFAESFSRSFGVSSIAVTAVTARRLFSS